ncbi:DUF6085 family protein [Amycolatopsis thermoflava]|uniref:DUF6085 family protein n=1 Tax=Amycolatopsis thermoflava TaxID=84480 RepID=UPI003F4A475D
MTNRDIDGYCPMGCGRTLFVADGGFITCSFVHCPRPDAAADILADSETEHTVQFDADGFTVRHPLRERLDDELMSCKLHAVCAGLPGPPPQLGTYRATLTTGDRPHWTFAALEDPF